MQQTRQDRLPRMFLLHGTGRALQDMANRAWSKPKLEEIDQRWFRWHGLQRLKRIDVLFVWHRVECEEINLSSPFYTPPLYSLDIGHPLYG